MLQLLFSYYHLASVVTWDVRYYRIGTDTDSLMFYRYPIGTFAVSDRYRYIRYVYANLKKMTLHVKLGVQVMRRLFHAAAFWLNQLWNNKV